MLEIEAAIAVKDDSAAESVARSIATEVKSGSLARDVAKGSKAARRAEDWRSVLTNLDASAWIGDILPAKERAK